MTGSRPLTKQELQAVLAHLEASGKARDAAWIAVQAYGGWRIGSVLSLTVGDVWQCGRVVDEVYVSRTHMKGKKEGRRIPLHPEAKRYLEAWLTVLLARPGVDAKTPLWLSRKGGQALTRQSADAILKCACRACGLVGELSTHSLRKFFTVSVYEGPVIDHDPVKLMRCTGHRSLQALIYYLNACSDEEAEKAILSI